MSLHRRLRALERRRPRWEPSELFQQMQQCARTRRLFAETWARVAARLKAEDPVGAAKVADSEYDGLARVAVYLGKMPAAERAELRREPVLGGVVVSFEAWQAAVAAARLP